METLLRQRMRGLRSVSFQLPCEEGAQAAADLVGAGAAGLAAAQAFRSQLPQDAAEYVRLNALPRPGPAAAAATADHRPAQ